MNGRRRRALYFRWRRSPWDVPLRTSSVLDLQEVNLDLRGDPAGYIRRLVSVARSTRAFRPELLLAESAGIETLPLLFLRRISGARLAVRIKGDVWTEWSDAGEARGFFTRLVRRLNVMAALLLFERADAVLPISAAIEDLAALHSGRVRLSRVVGNPAPRPRVRANEGGSPPPFLTMTNFNFRRKVEPLPIAARVLSPLLDELNRDWTILGGGELLDGVREELGRVSNRIHCLGHVDIEPHLETSPVFLYFSGLDGLPSALLEAAAAGCPLVVNRGSPAAALLPAGAGLVVDLSAPEEARARIAELAANPSLRQRLGNSAQDWVKSQFSDSTIQRQLEEAIATILTVR